ncbi:MAG: EscR/YscR/HrcR family type III secretion system export apparatus protein [Deltaproteobacteria bacterium]|nr:EscR/YscR/HrcR family type III secretion system export apparatus protein [Deltaproteobacteria bacterium]
MPENSYSAFALFLDLPFLGLLLLIVFALILSSYVKIATVLSFVRAGFGFTGMPSVFITGGLALVLSLFIMMPTLTQSISKVDEAVGDKKLASDVARVRGLALAAESWKEFIFKNTTNEARLVFVALAEKLDKRSNRQSNQASIAELENSWRILAPTFILSELKKAFATGLYLFLPFLLIDLLVAAVLMSLNIVQLNPYLTSLPLKVLVFVALDGWNLVSFNLLNTYLS